MHIVKAPPGGALQQMPAFSVVSTTYNQYHTSDILSIDFGD